MIIVAGGDSFVYGSELSDCNKTWSNSTFTALLASGDDYVCVARPGYGNDSISRSTITSCQGLLGNNLGVIVSWTFPGRYEFKFTYDTGQITKEWCAINSWTTTEDPYELRKEFRNDKPDILENHVRTLTRAKETGVAEFATTFYKHVGSGEYWEVYSSLKEIVYLQNYLKLNNIPYLFTCADNRIFFNYTASNPDANISALVNQIDMTRWYWFPEGTGANQTEQPRGFYQWAMENKYQVGATHPLEQAHYDAYQLIQDKFNEMVKESVQ